VIIQPYTPEYENGVIELWKACNLIRPQNDPKKDIDRKMKVNPELFLIGLSDGKVIASAMGGYEGHRGWINYVGVHPEYREKGYGRQTMEAIEKKLLERGCPKINLQVRTGNTSAVAVYNKLGYKIDDVISMGKRLIEN
jgi:ribosomal protein S18 acetylase RimI-like enzyme